MRKILLLVFGACTLVLLTAGTLYAETMTLPPPGSASVTAEGDNGIKSLDVPLNLEDQLFSWLNTISEAMGLKVTHDTDIHAIAISDPEKSILRERVKLLESAVVSPHSPKEAADTWAQGVLDGNGALQFAMLSSDLRKVYQPVLESYAWNLQGMGPSFSSYQVESQTMAAGDVYKYVIRFQCLVSAVDAAPQIATLQVEKSTYMYGREAWLVTGVDYPLSTIYHNKQTNQTNNNLAHIIPTMSGTVSAIKDGRLYLANVQYSMDPRNPDEPKPDPVLVLPHGSWINGHHWQSDGDSLDLFLGEPIHFNIRQSIFYPDSYQKSGMQFVNCIVQSVTGDKFEAAIYSGCQTWKEKIGEITLRLAPYSHPGIDPFVKPGDKLIVGYFGDDTDHIVWQFENVNP